jgi:hypothetical protein
MCKFLYKRKIAISTWLKWLKFNHVGYKNIIMNTHIIESLLHNNIPKPIIKVNISIIKYYLANEKHRTNIIDLHEKNYKLTMSLRHQD